ncbi:hypothetical protein BC936DRAFT_149714 [Jimgerdemannia flammicorona]|uniref:SPRY domain-containing protein n=1 Tax=Jimgerdemannia flammicorona TaxID=994334 RepID=A0A433D090_9FUNG|nr:hypothetical protein BC936DRAFT_149714 [Jimgerdemannia flammicorona]
MIRHVNFLLLCPHRLSTLVHAISALGTTAPHFLALAHYACANTVCSPDHPSGYRGRMHGEWDQDHLGIGLVVSDNGACVEYPHRPTVGFLQGGRTARLSQPLTMSSGGHHRLSIVIERTGVYSQQSLTEVGLVGARFNESIALWTAQTGWSFQSYGGKSFLVTPNRNGRDRYGKVIVNGDVVTLRLDMNERTCALEINGEDFGVAWKDLPDKVYPAVTLFPPAMYRIVTED